MPLTCKQKCNTFMYINNGALVMKQKQNQFQLVDKSSVERGIFSIRMEEKDIQKLNKWAIEEKKPFHRFVKSILNGYIVYRENNSR